MSEGLTEKSLIKAINDIQNMRETGQWDKVILPVVLKEVPFDELMDDYKTSAPSEYEA